MEGYSRFLSLPFGCFSFYGRLGFGKSQIDLESSESVGLWQVSDRLGVIRSFVVWYVLSGRLQ